MCLMRLRQLFLRMIFTGRKRFFVLYLGHWRRRLRKVIPNRCFPGKCFAVYVDWACLAKKQAGHIIGAMLPKARLRKGVRQSGFPKRI